jgi:hypothetical protein
MSRNVLLVTAFMLLADAGLRRWVDLALTKDGK